MIIDTFTYNGEADILEIRLNILNDYVDQFIIVEAPTTFSGKPKPLYYEEQKERFKKWESKIKYYVISEDYTPEEVLAAESSPNTQGASHWKHEFLQKESIKKALTHLKDNDIVFIGDVDEIWDPKTPFKSKGFEWVAKLKLKVYSYYLNNLSNEEFWGTIVGPYKLIKNVCLNHVRSGLIISYSDKCVPPDTSKTGINGWHFTSMGGYKEVKRKLEDSYTEETYANEAVMAYLGKNIQERKDFLGRNFTYTIDESDWPQYLKDNKEKYEYLVA